MSCFAKTLLVAVAALVGLSHGRKSKSIRQDINWLLGLEKPLPPQEKPVPATSDQAPGFLTQHESQEVFVSDASQLDVSQLTSFTIKPESASMKPERASMKPETALISQISQLSQSVAGGSHTSAASQKSAASPDDVILRNLEQTIMAMARAGKASNATIAAIEDIEVIIDDMAERIFAISDGYRAAVNTSQLTIDECLVAWSAMKEPGNYPPSVCALTNSSAVPSASALLSSKAFADTASTASDTSAAWTRLPIASHQDVPATCTHLLVQSSNMNSTQIILGNNKGITFGTLLKLETGGSREEIVEVKSNGAIIKLHHPLLFDHSMGACADIFAFGTDYYDHLQGVSCDTTGHCTGNGIASYEHLVDPVPLRLCREKQNATWKRYEAKRAPLHSMGLLKNDLCEVFILNSSESNWPDINSYCAPQSLNNMLKFYNESYRYYLAYHHRIVEANKTCHEAERNYNIVADQAGALLVEYQNQKAICDREQDSLDSTACDARESMGRCELGYGDCYHRQVDHTLSEYNKANVTATRYSGEMRAILRIRCLLDALLASTSKEVDTKIEACSHAYYFDHPNVTYLEVYPPSIPCPGECESLPYQPGTLPYQMVFYAPYQKESHPCTVRCCHDKKSSFTFQPIFVLGSFSTNACPAGASPIKESSECEEAQAFLESTMHSTVTTWQGDKSSPDWPGYCHQVTGGGAPGVWWNSDTIGSASSTARPICKDIYIPGPKVPHAAASTWCQNTRMPLPLAKQLCDKHTDCEVITSDDCDDGRPSWFYCRTTLEQLLTYMTSPVQDACTKVKVKVKTTTTTTAAPAAANNFAIDLFR